ncbi:MAG: GTP-binding protein [Candidatus Lokiarchaeota archaeon]|nr:GTP-binding protein [Candidatus Lokiarchaeota archaeon]
MDVSEKIPINLGLFGHIDSGKTAVAEVLSEIISTAGIDAHPQSKQRGITIDLGFTSFVLEEYLVTLVDAPGHADLLKISASSIEIIDLALVVIDINKGPQIQTGEHLVMIESLGIEDIIVILNKTDLYSGELDIAIEKTRRFFESTNFGRNIPIYAVSAKEKTEFEALKQGIYESISRSEIQRLNLDDIIVPIDHHFMVKGIGSVLTGTIVAGTVKVGDELSILPINVKGRVKNIQIFHQNVQSARTGNRVGLNMKDVDVKNIYRGCYATDNIKAFDFCRIADVRVTKSSLFKPDTNFGTQLHITIGMATSIGKIYPYKEEEGKKIRTSVSGNKTEFRAFLWFNERVLMRKTRNKMLLSRLDLPPTTLRILGSAKLIDILEKPPTLHKYKTKVGTITNPNHSHGIVCTGLAQSIAGARKIVGRELESPFTKIKNTFGTKGAVIVGTEGGQKNIEKNDRVIMKELRSFQLKNI